MSTPSVAYWTPNSLEMAEICPSTLGYISVGFYHPQTPSTILMHLLTLFFTPLFLLPDHKQTWYS